MGPRHLSRGYEDRLSTLTHTPASFNGAAASEPRILPGWGGTQRLARRFNGAAASEPRILLLTYGVAPGLSGFNGAAASEPRIRPSCLHSRGVPAYWCGRWSAPSRLCAKSWLLHAVGERREFVSLPPRAPSQPGDSDMVAGLPCPANRHSGLRTTKGCA